MSFWLSLLGYQALWFVAVIGAAHDLVWPALAGVALYASVQLVLARNFYCDLGLIVLAFVLGCVLDGMLSHAGLIDYAAAGNTLPAPAWILALWIAFALTLSQSLRWLQQHLGWAALLGAGGGPLAYLGAARVWQVVTLIEPSSRGVIALALGWSLATPLLASFARYACARQAHADAAPAHGTPA